MTEQKNSRVWAAASGAFVATLVLLFFLVLSVIWPTESPIQDGALRGAISTFLFSPVFFIIIFVYFLILSIKPDRTLSWALVVQSVVLVPLALFIFYMVSKNEDLFSGIVSGIYTFLFLSIIIGLGAWAWSR